jgi:hypothetical protein
VRIRTLNWSLTLKTEMCDVVGGNVVSIALLAFSKKSPLVLMNSCITYLDSRRCAVPFPFVYSVAIPAGNRSV